MAAVSCSNSSCYNNGLASIRQARKYERRRKAAIANDKMREETEKQVFSVMEVGNLSSVMTMKITKPVFFKRAKRAYN